MARFGVADGRRFLIGVGRNKPLPDDSDEVANGELKRSSPRPLARETSNLYYADGKLPAGNGWPST
ncbi:MAG: hypothetical protein M3Z15_02965 [Pseudomonadota bacterium]|nr:hypothetical protein [Pseudomonadota bacterium]